VIEHASCRQRSGGAQPEIEITENMLMVNSDGNLDKLQKIRELGASQ
jgi:hypothetical protein